MNERLIVARGDAFERGRIIGERTVERIRKVLRTQQQADVDNARHPREAVQGRKAKSPRARTKATAPGRQIERGR